MMLNPCGTLTLSRERFRHNVAFFRSVIPPGAKISAVVKANAYGHGLACTLQLLTENQVNWCSVFSLSEAAAVLHIQPSMNVHVLCPVSFNRRRALDDAAPFPADPAIARQVHLTIQDVRCAELLNAEARASGQSLQVQIQLDVGLTRQGCVPEELGSIVQAVRRMDHLCLTGVFAHFSHGETPGSDISQRQYETFLKLTRPLREDGVLTHIHNSGGAIRNVPIHIDLVRIGIGLYGLQPSMEHAIQELQPVAELTAPVVTLHHRLAGTGVGYGHQFITTRDTQIAILPVGYADGYRRELGGVTSIQINRRNYPIVGRISMDQMAVDVTGGDVQVGDAAVLISSDPQSDISMDRLAQRCRTIGYELATGLGSRLTRVLI